MHHAVDPMLELTRVRIYRIPTRPVARSKAAGRVAWKDSNRPGPYILCQASKGILVRQGSNPVNGSPFAFAQVSIRICVIDSRCISYVTRLQQHVGLRTLLPIPKLAQPGNGLLLCDSTG
jgi:hypothetical protein